MVKRGGNRRVSVAAEDKAQPGQVSTKEPGEADKYIIVLAIALLDLLVILMIEVDVREWRNH